MAYERDDDGRSAYGRGDFGNRGERYGYGQEPDRGRYGGDRFETGSRHKTGRNEDRSSGGSDDRGFFDRAGDEVMSWFGDDEAERRRERDRREDERNYRQGGTGYGNPQARQQQTQQRQPHHDPSYHDWRQRQIDALDRDYEDYRRENQSRFDTEFHGWRTQRQTQRSSLQKVEEHMEVVGSDGTHIGTVDKVRGDRIILTKNDSEAGGHHHSIPCSWIESVEDKVTIRKSAVEAKTAWRDEERNGALFNERSSGDEHRGDGPHNLNRAFSGTY